MVGEMIEVGGSRSSWTDEKVRLLIIARSILCGRTWPGSIKAVLSMLS